MRKHEGASSCKWSAEPLPGRQLCRCPGRQLSRCQDARVTASRARAPALRLGFWGGELTLLHCKFLHQRDGRAVLALLELH